MIKSKAYENYKLLLELLDHKLSTEENIVFFLHERKRGYLKITKTGSNIRLITDKNFFKMTNFFSNEVVADLTCDTENKYLKVSEYYDNNFESGFKADEVSEFVLDAFDVFIENWLRNLKVLKYKLKEVKKIA